MMFKNKIFLSAEWRHLAMINYEVPASVLLPFLPAGTELDLWHGKALVSLVGFMFLDTRICSLSIPFHIDFEEVNLRFYIKRHHPDGVRRGVAFIKEIVPKSAIAFFARMLYGENYISMPMGHTIKSQENEIAVEYRFKANARWQRFGMVARGEATFPVRDSEAEFITEHYWGYVTHKKNVTIEYAVKHPQWRLWDANDVKVDIDCRELYGKPFENLFDKEPISAFLAEGSAITVSKAEKLYVSQ